MFFKVPGIASDTWHMVEWLTLSHVSISEENSKQGESLRDDHVSSP